MPWYYEQSIAVGSLAAQDVPPPLERTALALNGITVYDGPKGCAEGQRLVA